jgi:hypothetical protein
MRKIPKHEVSDLDSFNKVTSNGRELAGLYFYSVLDFLVDLTELVSQDFFDRPHLFLEPGDPPVSGPLAFLNARSGSHEHVPSRQQRERTFRPLFGQPGLFSGDGSSDFVRLRDELVRATTDTVQRVFETGLPALLQRVRDTTAPFQAYLAGQRGMSLSWSRSQALPVITEGIAYTILRSPAVSSVYSIARPPNADFPYTEDANGDKLVEEISTYFASRDGRVTPITRERFSNIQRVALRGTEALATIIDFAPGAPDDDLDILVRKVYGWGSALLDAREGTVPAAVAGMLVPAGATQPT